MPPHASHIFQPLYFFVFLAIKAPTKKQKFIECYHEVRRDRFTKAKMQGGWRAAGLFPFNRQKGLKNPFALSSTKECSKTPQKQTKKRQFDERTIPQKPSDVFSCIQSLHARSELTRQSRTAMYAAAKSTGRLQAELAEQRLLSNAQTLEIDHLSA